jgi:hypothetical protein
MAFGCTTENLMYLKEQFQGLTSNILLKCNFCRKEVKICTTSDLQNSPTISQCLNLRGQLNRRSLSPIISPCLNPQNEQSNIENAQTAIMWRTPSLIPGSSRADQMMEDGERAGTSSRAIQDDEA